MLDARDAKARPMRSVAVLLLGLWLASCATDPAGTASRADASAGPPSETATGRLVVYVQDQNGMPLDRATVELKGRGRNFYRTVRTTNVAGEVTFNGVPQEVEVSVTHQYGSYGQSISVPQTAGAAELRITLQTFGAPEPQNDASGQDPGQGRGRF